MRPFSELLNYLIANKFIDNPRWLLKQLKMNNNKVLVFKNPVNFYICLGKLSRHKKLIQCGHI